MSACPICAYRAAGWSCSTRRAIPSLSTGAPSLPSDVRTGFGDLNLGATYAIPTEILGGFEVKLTGRIKLPTASSRKRLSTGKADYGMSVDVSRAYGRWQPFVTLGYLISGKPATFSLKNTLSVSAGTSYELTDSLVAIASYDYDSASSPLVASSQDLFGSLGWLVNDKITLTGYATNGMSSGSPKVGAGLIVTYGFQLTLRCNALRRPQRRVSPACDSAVLSILGRFLVSPGKNRRVRLVA
jgi:hypothetical protein